MNAPLRAWIFVSLAVASGAPALAFDFVVTRYDDPLPGSCLATDCSLREAVAAANADFDDDRILLSAGVYALTLVADGGLDILHNTEIIGVGAGITVLDAAGLGDSAISANQFGLVFALRKLTVRNSDTSGIFLSAGTHTVEDCEFRDNGSTTADAGIQAASFSVITLRRVSLVDNSGNGLLAVSSSTTVENSTFSGNGARDLQIITAVSFSCTHCTIHDPADITEEVGVFDSTVTFANSIVDGDCFLDTGSVINSLGGDIESPGNTCSFSQASDQNSKTSGQLALAALADNGGQTRTHLPGATSVATGGAFDTLCLADDQRGVTRTTDCESGSVERTSARVETPIFIDGFLQGSTGAWSSVSL